jgi:hypothetical protein
MKRYLGGGQLNEPFIGFAILAALLSVIAPCLAYYRWFYWTDSLEAISRMTDVLRGVAKGTASTQGAA